MDNERNMAIDMRILADLLDDRPFAAANDPGKPVEQPTTVYRVEMPNGNGPYNSGLPNARDIYKAIANPFHPEMDCVRLANQNHENINQTGSQFRAEHGHADYGCDSLDAVKAWFPIKAREFLAGLGGSVVEYELAVGDPLLGVGNGEVIFNRHTAKRVRSLGLVDLK
jgi:hypothetical protein